MFEALKLQKSAKLLGVLFAAGMFVEVLLVFHLLVNVWLFILLLRFKRQQKQVTLKERLFEIHLQKMNTDAREEIHNTVTHALYAARDRLNNAAKNFNRWLNGNSNHEVS